jgi:hypothetical protein
LAVLRHRHPRRRLEALDRLFWVLLSRVWTGWREAPHVVQPETVIRWHRQGFRYYWRWKSRGRGRPNGAAEIRGLIQRMCRANPLWGAPRIHGELLKLGIEVSEATVSKYMVKRGGPPSQRWRAFLDNHAKELIALDLFYRSDSHIQSPIRARGLEALATTDCAFQCYGASDSQLDRTTTPGGLRP